MGGATTFAAEADSQASSATTDVKAVFTAPETQNPNPVGPDGVKPSDPEYNDKTDNKDLNPEGNFGLAYVPKAFDFGSHQLTEESNFKATKKTSFNVGVKDTTYGTTGWKVTAILSDLKELTNGEATATSNATITSSESPIMSGTKGKIYKSVYDLDLEDVTLNIPDMSQVSTGTYTGTVNWNLSVVE